MYGKNLRAYGRAKINAEISVADPYIITKMLLQGVFERLAQAKGAIERGDLHQKASRLASASNILQFLKSTLDFSQNERIAGNLYDLYSFMQDQIVDATIKLDCKPIDNAIHVLMPIKNAWDKLPVRAREEANRIKSPQERMEQFSYNQSLSQGVV